MAGIYTGVSLSDDVGTPEACDALEAYLLDRIHMVHQTVPAQKDYRNALNRIRERKPGSTLIWARGIGLDDDELLSVYTLLFL